MTIRSRCIEPVLAAYLLAVLTSSLQAANLVIDTFDSGSLSVQLTSGETSEALTTDTPTGSVGDRRGLRLGTGSMAMNAGQGASMLVQVSPGVLDISHTASAVFTSYRVSITDDGWPTTPFDLATQLGLGGLGLSNPAHLFFNVDFDITDFPGTEQLFSMDVITTSGTAQYSGLLTTSGASLSSPETIRLGLLSTTSSPDFSQVEEFLFHFQIGTGDGSGASIFQISEISAGVVPEPSRALLAAAGIGILGLSRRRNGRRWLGRN